jgi:integrase
VRKKLITENPFGDMRGCAVQANRARDYLITREEAYMVIDACPDAQWRLLFALSRFGGLRCPSEHVGLMWQDVDWARNQILVRSPKTEHHPGGESRWLPLFPELRPYLEEVFDQAEPGTEYVITRYRDRNSNLRTQLERIIAKAGLKPWPKLFQNLRASRETELAEHWPEHVACAWIGNSRAVARKHYLQITEEHFEQAAIVTTAGKNQTAQNPAQQPAVLRRTDSQSEFERTEDQQALRGCVTMRNCAATSSYPAWTRTRNEGTKNPSVSDYTTG